MFKVSSVTYQNKRQENQDSFWWGVFESPQGIGCVATVCDGMGGLSHGGEASRYIAELVRNTVVADEGSNDNLHTLPEETHRQVMTWTSRAGSTADILHLQDGSYNVTHIGDGRVYHFKDGVWFQVTEDHSAINYYRSKGVDITPELVAKTSGKITRGIGKDPWVAPDVYTGSYNVGDYFLVCSDGFWHYLSHEGTSSFEPVAGCLDDWAHRAMSWKETDNITALLIEVIA